MTKRKICPHCRGTGADDPDDIKTCPYCNGVGTVEKRQQVGAGYYQIYRSQCDKCHGAGKIIKSKCQVCTGEKLIDGDDTFSLFIEKGIKNRHKIVKKN